MRNKNFFDLTQATNYLSKSIVRVAKSPVYVLTVRDKVVHGVIKFEMEYVPCANPSANPSKILTDDKEVDMNPVPLGFMRYFDGVRWKTFDVKRYPARKWSIGLARSNLAATDPITGTNISPDYYREFLPSKSLSDTILGKYPSFERAVKTSEKEECSVPFSRRFLVYKGGIFYKSIGEKVADLRAKGVEFLDQYSFLAEAFQEDC